MEILILLPSEGKGRTFESYRVRHPALPQGFAGYILYLPGHQKGLDGMDKKTLEILILQKENQTLEFKKSTAQLRAAFETVCAFLNAQGGDVLVGVSNDGQIIGQDVTDATQQEIARELNKIEPSTDIEINYCPTKDNKQIIRIHVKKGSHAPYIYDGRAFLRNQTTTIRMPQHRYDQLLVEREHLNHSWEELEAINCSINLLDQDEIYLTIKQVIDAGRIPARAFHDTVEDALIQLSLLNKGVLKNAAIALFAKAVIPQYSQCLIKMARFRGKDTLGEFIDNQQVYGNAFKILSEASNFITRHLPIESFFAPGRFERVDKPALPVMAVREALINAICHRDYKNRSSSIFLAIFDDGLEIWNNGGLPS